MKRYSVAVKNGCKLEIRVMNAKSIRDLKLQIFDDLVEKGTIAIVAITDNKIAWETKHIKKE